MLNSVIKLILLTSSLYFVARPILGLIMQALLCLPRHPFQVELLLSIVNMELNCERQLVFLQGGRQLFTVKICNLTKGTEHLTKKHMNVFRKLYCSEVWEYCICVAVSYLC